MDLLRKAALAAALVALAGCSTTTAKTKPQTGQAAPAGEANPSSRSMRAFDCSSDRLGGILITHSTHLYQYWITSAR